MAVVGSCMVGPRAAAGCVRVRHGSELHHLPVFHQHASAAGAAWQRAALPSHGWQACLLPRERRGGGLHHGHRHQHGHRRGLGCCAGGGLLAGRGGGEGAGQDYASLGGCWPRVGLLFALGAQVFIKTPTPGVGGNPIKSLVGFERVFLQPGQSTTLQVISVRGWAGCDACTPVFLPDRVCWMCGVVPGDPARRLCGEHQRRARSRCRALDLGSAPPGSLGHPGLCGLGGRLCILVPLSVCSPFPPLPPHAHLGFGAVARMAPCMPSPLTLSHF